MMVTKRRVLSQMQKQTFDIVRDGMQYRYSHSLVGWIPKSSAPTRLVHAYQASDRVGGDMLHLSSIVLATRRW
jgi:hypothetical protein